MNRFSIVDFVSTARRLGLGILIAVGKWGGIGIEGNTSNIRIALGWLAITVLPFDGDYLFKLAFEEKEMTESSFLTAQALDERDSSEVESNWPLSETEAVGIETLTTEYFGRDKATKTGRWKRKDTDE